MKEYQRKTWDDPLIDAANKGRTTAERRLRSMLRDIARTKYGGIPLQIIGELQRINDKVRFKWYPGPRGGDKGPHLTSNVEEPESRAPESLTEAFKDPRGLFDDQMYNHFILDLIPKLRDRNWVEALRECPGCRKLILSNAKKRKFCSDRCKKKIWARDNRQRIYCAGDKRKITLLDCRVVQRDYLYDECLTCPYYKKGGDN